MAENNTKPLLKLEANSASAESKLSVSDAPPQKPTMPNLPKTPQEEDLPTAAPIVKRVKDNCDAHILLAICISEVILLDKELCEAVTHNRAIDPASVKDRAIDLYSQRYDRVDYAQDAYNEAFESALRWMNSTKDFVANMH